jgi:hypothetical protein
MAITVGTQSLWMADMIVPFFGNHRCLQAEGAAKDPFVLCSVLCAGLSLGWKAVS